MKLLYTRDLSSDIYRQVRAIRQAVFIEGQGISASREVDVDEANCLHFLLLGQDEVPAATCRLLFSDDGKTASLQRMAVLEAYQGQGLGRELLCRVLTYARSQGLQQVTAHSQMTALPFYQKLGFLEVGQVFLDAGIPHVAVVRSLQ